MAEDFRFHQLSRDRATVDGNEGGGAAFALFVDGLGTDFLTGAGFSRDEYGGLGVGGGFDNPIDCLHGKGLADETGIAFAGPGLDIHHHLGQLLTFQGVIDRNPQAVRVEGFDDEIIGTRAHGFHGDIDGTVGGDDHYGTWQLVGLDIFQDFQPVHIRQFQVEQNNCGWGVPDYIQTFRAGGRTDDLHRLFGKVLPIQHRQRWGIFNEKNKGVLGHQRFYLQPTPPQFIGRWGLCKMRIQCRGQQK